MFPAPHPQPRQGAAGTVGADAQQERSSGGGTPGGQWGSQSLSTTLKWSEEGELSALDLDRIVARLADADPVASHLSLHHFGMAGRDPGHRPENGAAG
ncbi:hypothetical protein CPCC7001_2502 [Cyanobium sp. PCC 7001]|uniref:hypothetical protein n=1 Tax=Cyanobium sp. PCC 7001 TaxID=180281 RepID=UPI000180503C|nr:hypothetical protein [Cyanobium sp. PCC 7001]EDY39621.1 hypothetical protein CPCC7001_2502 [Cyanobium sp. PCC 7001]